MAYPTTFLVLQTALYQKLRMNATDDATKVSDWINQAYAFACAQTKFVQGSAATSALSASATSASIPATILSIDYITATPSGGTAQGPMEEVAFEELLELRAYSGGSVSANGAPSHYAVRQSTIEFWPSAAGGEVLTVYGETTPTALSASGDTPVIPEPYPKVIEYLALCDGAEYKKDPDLAYYRQIAEQWLARWRGFCDRRQGAQPGYLRVHNSSRRAPLSNSVDVR